MLHNMLCGTWGWAPWFELLLKSCEFYLWLNIYLLLLCNVLICVVVTVLCLMFHGCSCVAFAMLPWVLRGALFIGCAAKVHCIVMIFRLWASGFLRTVFSSRWRNALGRGLSSLIDFLWCWFPPLCWLPLHLKARFGLPLIEMPKHIGDTFGKRPFALIVFWQLDGTIYRAWAPARLQDWFARSMRASQGPVWLWLYEMDMGDCRVSCFRTAEQSMACGLWL